MVDRIKLTDHELLYAATARCRCGAGLAYPIDSKLALQLQAWICSAVLKLETEEKATGLDPFNRPASVEPKHDALDFAFWKVREETSVNNKGGHTTRPPGTIARTVGKATCPKCQSSWQSEPYDATSQQWPDEYNGRSYLRSGHWMSGPCPHCGHTVGGGTSWNTSDGPPIDKRYSDVVLDSK